MTRDQLDAIRARVEAATPGPWEPQQWYGIDDGGWAAIGPHHESKDCNDDEPESDLHEKAKRDSEFIAHAREDVPTLLAEVERLTAEVEGKVTQNVALVGMNGRLQQEVERLNALGTLLSADIQRLTRRVAEDEADWMALRAEAAAAFQRGVAAMREAAVGHAYFFAHPSALCGPTARTIADEIRDLPDPEDK